MRRSSQNVTAEKSGDFQHHCSRRMSSSGTRPSPTAGGPSTGRANPGRIEGLSYGYSSKAASLDSLYTNPITLLDRSETLTVARGKCCWTASSHRPAQAVPRTLGSSLRLLRLTGTMVGCDTTTITPYQTCPSQHESPLSSSLLELQLAWCCYRGGGPWSHETSIVFLWPRGA